MCTEQSMDVSRAIISRPNYGELPKIYARLAQMMRDHLMRSQGLSETEATAKALETISKQAGDLIVYMDDMDKGGS